MAEKAHTGRKQLPYLIILGVVIFVALIAGILVLGGNDKDTEAKKSKRQHIAEAYKSLEKQQNLSKSTNPDTVVEADSVAVTNYTFSPRNIKVAVGTTVTWTNNDGVDHDLAASDGQAGPQSGAIHPGETYSYTFYKAGKYAYNSPANSFMTGTVTVE
jgi:plastocyanin